MVAHNFLQLKESQQQGAKSTFGQHWVSLLFMYKHHFRTVLTPLDHQITIKSWSKSDYIIYTKVLSPKLDVYASNGLSPFFLFGFIPKFYCLIIIIFTLWASNNIILLARHFFPSNGISKLIFKIFNLDYGIRTFVSLKSVQIYEIYLNQLLYPGFRCCTCKKWAFHTLSCNLLVLIDCHKLSVWNF